MASPLEQIFITGYNKGLVNNKRPFLIPDQAWQTMENAYTWRDRIVKREGLDFLGRLRRVITAQAEGFTSGTTTDTIADLLSAFRGTEPNAELQPKSITISVGFPIVLATFTDLGDGTFSVTGTGLAAGSFVNYNTGQAVIHYTVAPPAGQPITANFGYYPTLPVMGISSQDQAGINSEQTVIFDTRYAYIFNAGFFQEYLTPPGGITWNSSDSDFFYTYNYRGSGSNIRLLFETNFVNTAQNPMRYSNNAVWTTFQPIISVVGVITNVVFTCRIIIAYFGRLLLLNTWEGDVTNQPAALNFFARCRFSALGDPTAATAFRQDIFGQGGFIDAPTTEMIVGAEFVKNTLIISFESSKWQLRYVGEYGLPFVWERISVDYGSESTFSTVPFDGAVLDVGDKAILTTNAIETKRIDLETPDQIFFIQNANNGPQRVWGIRDYFKELVFWNYPDVTTSSDPGKDLTFPNKVLLYNYRNNTWAIFRDSVTAFGYFQYSLANTPNVTWDDLSVTWDDENVTWNDIDQGNPGFQYVIAGNQEGYVHVYASKSPDDPSLTIRDVSVPPALFPVTLTIPNHNLLNGEIIYLTGLLFLSDINFLPVTTNLNDAFFRVTSIDKDNITLSQWDFATQQYSVSFSPTFMQGAVVIPAANVTYIGNGEVTLFPKLNLISKDINIYQGKGMATKLSRLNFLMQPTNSSGMTVDIWINSAIGSVSGNLSTGDQGVSTVLNPSFYPPASEYAWFSFYATLSAQYFNINLTYDDNFMNTLSTHQSAWTLYAITAFCKPGGKIIF